MGKMPIVVDETEPVGEIEPPFESRDVQIKRGLNVRDFFDMEEEIGRGKFGTVFKCREKSTGLRLAAKFVQAAKKADRANVEREVDIMKSLRNSRLIQLYDAYDDGKKEICLLLELIEGGELFERVIDDDFVLTERACAIFMRQICEGIQFIHLQHVLHLDMKPENILCLTREGNRIKLIDFGLARKYDPSKKLQVLFGTPEFVAPEVVNFESIAYGTDMWSVGIICYVLLSGLSPFMGETDVETMANVTIAKYDFDDEAFNDVSAEAKDFISKLLVKQISKRMTATECLRHPWLRVRPPLAVHAPSPPQLESAEEEEEEDDDDEDEEEETEDEGSSPALSPLPVNGNAHSPLPNEPLPIKVDANLHTTLENGQVKPVNEAELVHRTEPLLNETEELVVAIGKEEVKTEVMPEQDPPRAEEAKPEVIPESLPAQPPVLKEDAQPEVVVETQPEQAAVVKEEVPVARLEVKSASSGKENKPLGRETKATKDARPVKDNKNKTPLSNAAVTSQTPEAPEDVLQLTKVNLRQFVERWNSHPNSPFQACSDSPRRTISLLISSPVPPLDVASDSPDSMAAMSPSPQQSPGSPKRDDAATLQQAPPRETDTKCNQPSHAAHVSTVASAPRATIASSVESAIEQTSALLRSVKESLIRQMESGTAVRDRTGARVWERKGSGHIAGSPSSTPKRWGLTPAPSVDVPSNNNNNNNNSISVNNNNVKVVPLIRQPSQDAAGAQQAVKAVATVGQRVAAVKQPQRSLEPPLSNKKVVRQASTDGEWEEHQPVAARSYGFAKRHVIVDSSRTAVTSSSGTSSAVTSKTSKTSHIIKTQLHKP